MRATQTLPEGYRPLLSVDLQRDRRIAVRVNVIGTLVMAAMALAFNFLAVPFALFLGRMESTVSVILHVLAMLLGYAAYIMLHELTHAAVMKFFGAREVRFGFTGLYAYAGSGSDYFPKLPYLAVAMAPLVLWLIVFEVLRAVVPEDWDWVIWFLQIANVSGSVGDLYVSFRFITLPKESLIRDTGIAMDVYAAGRG